LSSSSGKLVKVAFAQQQPEAEMIQGLLSEHGIPSMLRRAAGFDVPDFLAAGPREILVAEELAGQAREVLEGTPGAD
jgi:Putative prokaryotic signal transducing protein